ncbi:hypothetical protein GVAV_002154 [Gurleya vavrai]
MSKPKNKKPKIDVDSYLVDSCLLISFNKLLPYYMQFYSSHNLKKFYRSIILDNKRHPNCFVDKNNLDMQNYKFVYNIRISDTEIKENDARYNVLDRKRITTAENIFLVQILSLLKIVKDEFISINILSIVDLQLFEDSWNKLFKSKIFMQTFSEIPYLFYKKYCTELKFCNFLVRNFDKNGELEETKHKSKNQKCETTDDKYLDCVFRDCVEASIGVFIYLIKNQFYKKSVLHSINSAIEKSKDLNITITHEEPDNPCKNIHNYNLNIYKININETKNNPSYIFYALRHIIKNKKNPKNVKYQIEFSLEIEKFIFDIILHVFKIIKTDYLETHKPDQIIRLISFESQAILSVLLEDIKNEKNKLIKLISKDPDVLNMFLSFEFNYNVQDNITKKVDNYKNSYGNSYPEMFLLTEDAIYYFVNQFSLQMIIIINEFFSSYENFKNLSRFLSEITIVFHYRKLYPYEKIENLRNTEYDKDIEKAMYSQKNFHKIYDAFELFLVYTIVRYPIFNPQDTLENINWNLYFGKNSLDQLLNFTSTLMSEHEIKTINAIRNSFNKDHFLKSHSLSENDIANSTSQNKNSQKYDEARKRKEKRLKKTNELVYVVDKMKEEGKSSIEDSKLESEFLALEKTNQNKKLRKKQDEGFVRHAKASKNRSKDKKKDKIKNNNIFKPNTCKEINQNQIDDSIDAENKDLFLSCKRNEKQPKTGEITDLIRQDLGKKYADVTINSPEHIMNENNSFQPQIENLQNLLIPSQAFDSSGSSQNKALSKIGKTQIFNKSEKPNKASSKSIKSKENKNVFLKNEPFTSPTEKINRKAKKKPEETKDQTFEIKVPKSEAKTCKMITTNQSLNTEYISYNYNVKLDEKKNFIKEDKKAVTTLTDSDVDNNKLENLTFAENISTKSIGQKEIKKEFKELENDEKSNILYDSKIDMIEKDPLLDIDLKTVFKTKELNKTSKEKLIFLQESDLCFKKESITLNSTDKKTSSSKNHIIDASDSLLKDNKIEQKANINIKKIFEPKTNRKESPCKIEKRNVNNDLNTLSYFVDFLDFINKDNDTQVWKKNYYYKNIVNAYHLQYSKFTEFVDFRFDLNSLYVIFEFRNYPGYDYELVINACNYDYKGEIFIYHQSLQYYILNGFESNKTRTNNCKMCKIDLNDRLYHCQACLKEILKNQNHNNVSKGLLDNPFPSKHIKKCQPLAKNINVYKIDDFRKFTNNVYDEKYENTVLMIEMIKIKNFNYCYTVNVKAKIKNGENNEIRSFVMVKI